MTKQEIVEEISRHYNSASKTKRKEFNEDIIYKLCLKDRAYEAALKRSLEIFYGATDSLTDLRRQMKKKQKLEKNIVEILAGMSKSERADLFAKVENEKLKNQ